MHILWNILIAIFYFNKNTWKFYLKTKYAWNTAKLKNYIQVLKDLIFLLKFLRTDKQTQTNQ